MKHTLYRMLLLVCVTQAAVAEQIGINDFAYGIGMSLDQNKLYEYRVDDLIYQKIVHKDLSDLRIFSQLGENVPYSVRHKTKSTLVEKETKTALRLFPIYTKQRVRGDDLNLRVEKNENGVIINIRSKDEPDANFPLAYYVVNLVEFDNAQLSLLEFKWKTTTANEVKNIYIASSNDLVRWQSIGKGSIAYLTSNGNKVLKNRVAVNYHKSKYLKIYWQKEEEPVELVSVMGVAQKNNVVEKERQHKMLIGKPDKEDPHSVYFDTGGQYPVDRIQLAPKKQNTVYNMRVYSGSNRKHINTLRYHGTVFNFQFEDINEKSLPIPLNKTSDRFWEIEFLSKEKSSTSESLEFLIGWHPHTIRFLSRNPGTYTIAYGYSEPLLRGPNLDVALEQLGMRSADIKPEIIKTSQSFDLGGKESLLAKKTDKVAYKKWVLWGILLIAILIMSVMSYRLFKKMNV